MLPSSSLQRAPGAVILLLLVVCVSYSNQLSGLSFQPALNSGRNTRQLVHYNFNEQEFVETPVENERRKRDVHTEASHPNITTHVNVLNDSHNSLIVYWAGKDVIICLAKDVNANSASTLHISRDYGATFQNATPLLSKDMPDGVKPVLDKFFNHPTNNGKFIFTDVTNHLIFTTDDYGTKFRRTSVLFVPDEILFDPYAEETIVAYEKNTTEKHMWISKDFGVSWTMVQEFVKSVSWDESSHPAKLYIQREEPDEKSAVLTSESSFVEHGDVEVKFTEVEEFEIKDEYMFATKKGVNDTLELWISYKRGPFLQALFPTHKRIKNYHIADVFDGQMFVCVTHENSISDLYVGSRSQSPSSMENPRFSLSLSGIVFFKPNMTWSDSWIDDVTDDSFVELHRVEGLRGVYIANVLKNSSESTNNKINLNEIISKVTFDNGGEWQVLKPPEFDDDGQPLYCHLVPRSNNGDNCSLQINQRLSEIFPVTRAVPVLSRKSAVGIIMATGTVNNSLKGHQGVFMSTDGAVTWKHLLQGNYLFGFGDHGGVIVAVKFYKLGDATDSLLYSINEGETWNKYKFYNETVRVLGLMTEPGENTTVFFVFGSIPKTQDGKTGHSWILIKVDLFNAFGGRKCDQNDYKLWSPWDSKPGRDCLLGKKDHYERRIPSHGCYNGRPYERLVNTTKCLCDRVDFECDFGYVEDELNGQVCKKDISDFSPGVKPEWCKPGDLYYNITRGYRKIPGDECEGGDVSRFLPETKSCALSNETEFMLVAKRDSVLRIDLNDFNRTEVLPLLNVRAVISMDYDMNSGYIYWADVNRDNVMRLKLDGNSEPEILVSTDLKSVEGLAFDWIAKNLYYCDAANARIEVIRTDVTNMGRMRKIVLDKTHLDKPRGIVVHPEKGYLFWTDWSSNNPCIGRSWLDGSNVKRIVENPTGTGQDSILRWPNGIAIDYEKNNLYWVDAFLDHLALVDFDGKNLKIFLKQDYRIRHPFAVSVYKDTIYWDDWNTHSIFGTRKNTDDPGKGAFLVTANHTRLMDLKIYGPGRQVGTNACSNHSCSHLCLSFPGGQNFTCECPDGLKKSDGNCVCPDGKPTIQNGRCSSNNCNGNATFTCKNSFCIPIHWKCDGDDDCGDNSDEDGTTCDPDNRCNPAQFQCLSDRKCIPDGWRCDYDNDCADGSDEHNCTDLYPVCHNATHFHCANNRCILSRWKCDGDNDCMDNSDELNCTTTPSGSCALNEFRCESSKRCISDQWRCDGDNDCGDGSDEKNCSAIACPDYKFHCKESNQCIMESWHCDGDTDCTKGEDERNCSAPVTLPPAVFPFPMNDCSKLKQTFQCTYTKKCIPTSWRCDGQSDCGPDDHTDELGCEFEISTTKAPAVTIEPHQKHCALDSWQCVSGECIRYGSVCDGYPDCTDHSDEQSCHDPKKGPTGCAADNIRCGLSNVCVSTSKVCDGKKDCPNNADESACFVGNSTSENQCNSGQHVCDDNICVPLSRMCNGNSDCIDGTDEVSCGSFQKVYQIDGIQVNPEGVDAREIEIEWWIDPDLSRGKELYYIPSYCEVKSNDCFNASKVYKQAKYKFTKLNPFTRYNVTVYVGDGPKIFPPSVYKLVNTIEYDPSPPYQLELRQPNVDELCATWKKPHTPNGIITKYILHFSPPPQPASEISLNESLCLSNKQSDPPFQPDIKYTFWVVAENSVGKSDPSDSVSYIFNGDAGKVVAVNLKEITESSATLTWTTSSGKIVQHPHYNITLTVADTTYPFKTRLMSEMTNVKVKTLAPGTQYEYEIIPIHKDGIRGVSFKGQFQTKGNKLPTVDGLIARPSANSTNVFEIVWTKPSNNKPTWKYAIYHGKTIDEIVQKNNPIKVSAFPVFLKNLEACEDYFVDVAIIENDGVGPLTEKPYLVKTGMDLTAPPKRLHIRDPQDKLDDVKVTVAWESPCPVMDKKIGYNITLRDIRLNNEFGLSNVSYSDASHLEQRIDIQYGGRYEVIVSTSTVGGRNSDPVIVQGPDIPFPLRVRQCIACPSPTIVWELPPLPKKVTKKGNITYVVWLSRDEKFLKYSTFSTNEPVFPFKDVLEEGLYFIAVSIKDSEGLESPKSSPIILQGFGTSGGSSAVTLDERSLVGIVVTVIVVLAILIAALSVFIVRHKRLQTSFLNFASSHYSTQSGSATFQQNLEEEQDSPVIRGFSDDEPLLVA